MGIGESSFARILHSMSILMCHFLGYYLALRLKKFQDDPVRVAVKKTGASKNAVMNWLGSLTSPVNTDKM